MKTKNTMAITEARKRIFDIAEAVQEKDAHVVLTERGMPKAVIISAQTFEKSIKRKGGSLLADGGVGYGFSSPSQMFPKMLIVRDESRIVYLSSNDQHNKQKEENVIKAQLYVQLIEKYNYPYRAVELAQYIRVGGEESRRYIEADIMINDDHGNVLSIFEVSPFAEYEENMDRVVNDLFDLAKSVSWIKKPQHLVYYSRKCVAGKAQEKISVIDYHAFNTFAAWKKSGRKCANCIPEHI